MEATHGSIERAYGVVVQMANEKVKNHLIRMKVRNANRVLKPLFEVLNETRNEMIKEYGTDGRIDPRHENWAEFSEELTKLMEETALVVGLKPFPPVVMGAFALSVADLDALEAVGLYEWTEEEAEETE